MRLGVAVGGQRHPCHDITLTDSRFPPNLCPDVAGAVGRHGCTVVHYRNGLRKLRRGALQRAVVDSAIRVIGLSQQRFVRTVDTAGVLSKTIPNLRFGFSKLKVEPLS